MKTCYCCNKESSSVINLPYFSFNLCGSCSDTYYYSLKLIDFSNI